MSLAFHHCYIFTEPTAPIVDELVAHGFIEGTPNTHPGQGTANRRIFFSNGMIEFIWIQNESESLSDLTSKTNLFERSQYQKSGYSPFGICVCSKNAVPAFTSWQYQPIYLPKGIEIWMAANKFLIWEPAIFHLLGVNMWSESNPPKEPTEHLNGANRIELIEVGMINYSELNSSDALKSLKNLNLFQFYQSTIPLMKIICKSKNNSQPKTYDLSPKCPLIIDIF